MGVTPEAVEIYAFAPGVEPSAIDVSVDKGVLSIAGERASTLPAGDEKVSVYADERFAGSFRRVVSLPEDADTARVEASYRNGVLKIVIPRHEASKPRRIEVKD
jgi:HSP20 family protein